MRSTGALIALGIVVIATSAANTHGMEEETLLLQQPTVSGDHVVFVYANDLWIVSRAGGEARRLTSDPGTETNPRLSPDGRHVAFSAQYDGNLDVYVMSIDGGDPRRLTWHPGGDLVQDWHPDGGKILFSSRRQSGPSVARLFHVDKKGGTPKALPVPRVAHASYDRVPGQPSGAPPSMDMT